MKAFIYSSKVFFMLTSIALFTACNNTKEEQVASEETNEQVVTLTQEQLKNVVIDTTNLSLRNISSVVKVTGTIDVPPQNMVSVSTPLGGYIASTKLLPGMHIYKGEVIAKMEDQQYIQLQQDYLITKSKLSYAEQEYVRQKELNLNKASSDKVLQQTETEYKTLRISLNALAEKLRLININPTKLSEGNLSRQINIYSPIDGYVSKVNVNIGKYVNPTDVLFELIDPSDIHLNLKVFEKDIDKLAIGQKLIAYTNTNPDKKYLCDIILISKDFDADRTAEVHCHFDKYDKNLLSGMYMNAEIEVKNHEAYTLPEDAIVNFEGKDYVFIANSKQAYTIQEVQLGVKENGFIEIKNTAALTGKAIVNKGAYTLLMKMKNKAEEE
ncbi:efflux RND transporter periplasmic adaptor subunit [Pedobacter glucosidilyticus]|uniref:efflux RND transporter periplasmic adaptor subunit n=1 Tax=Pedobacter glucosidilyticus TaxID=1122941 RepID=UPI0026EA435E|nr:efflux RND transporter periplasmic adaptor subunit [Pedobacter glucosidilyticus]